MTTLGMLVLTLAVTTESAGAATPPIGLGTATSYAVLAGSTITNTGASVLNGDRGLSPGTDVTGFPPGLLLGDSNTANAEALQAQKDLTVAYVDAAERTPAASVPAELGGSTFGPGTYVGATLELTGAMTIDADGDPDAVFLFKTNSTLVTASNSSVNFIDGANPCNVYWQVSSSATLGTDTDFVGTVMASESITANNGADVVGRLLARNGAVTLDENVITRPTCAALPPGSTTTAPASSTTLDPATTTSGPVVTTAPASSTTLATTTSGPVVTTAPASSITLATTTSGPVVTTAPASSTTPGPVTSGPATSVATTPPDQTLTSLGRGPGTPTTTPGSSTTTPGTTTGTLPRTGSSLGVPVGLGLLAIGLGAAILAMRRRLLST